MQGIYHIVASLFLIANGQPADDVTARMQLKVPFDTKAECEDYLNGPQMPMAKFLLEGQVGRDGEQFKIAYKCEAKSQDI